MVPGRACAHITLCKHLHFSKIAEPSPTALRSLSRAGVRLFLGALFLHSLVHLGRHSQHLLCQLSSPGWLVWSATFVYPGTGAPLAGRASFAAVEGPEALAAPAFTGSCPRKVPALLPGLCGGVPVLSVGLFEGCGSGGAGSQLRMAFSASSVSGSLSPFVACPSQVCLGCVPGIVEDDAVDLGLVEEKQRSAVLPFFARWCSYLVALCSGAIGFALGFRDFGAALARVSA